jgi:putative colanic acid biosysnthesis UDP-glucose lipid carrier transferase
MLKRSKIINRGKILSDLLLLGLIMCIIPANVDSPDENFYEGSHLLVLLTGMISWMFSARIMGLYEDFRMKPFSIEWVIFLKSFVLFILIVSFMYSQLLHSFDFSRKHLLYHFSLLFFLMPLQKLAIRISLKKYRNSGNQSRKVLIVGAGKNGMDFYKQYVKNKHFGYQLTGFLDDEPRPFLNGQYLGKTCDLDRILDKHEFDDIVVTLPIMQEGQIQSIVTAGEKEGKRVRIIPNYEQYGDGKLQVDNLGNLSIITLRSLPLDIIDNRIYKRTFDIVFSLLVLILLLSWVLPVISLLIKLTSRGPIIFKQERWGLNNKSILCYKFRSMVTGCKNVDAMGVYQQARKNDPRITPIGRFLRKTNLDEFPQFWNVFKGSMSIVGPRPHPVPLNMESKDSVENYMMRHWVKPGITGWAQVNGFRGETSDSSLMKKRVEYDMWYIENWSVWIDLQIIVQTITNMIKGESNAY